MACESKGFVHLFRGEGLGEMHKLGKRQVLRNKLVYDAHAVKIFNGQWYQLKCSFVTNSHPLNTLNSFRSLMMKICDAGVIIFGGFRPQLIC